MSRPVVFASESVTAAHPDKLCDRISDALVGRLLRQDAGAIAIAETAVATGIVFVALRHDADASIDVSGVARDVIREAGYHPEAFDVDACTVMSSVSRMDGEGDGAGPDPAAAGVSAPTGRAGGARGVRGVRVDPGSVDQAVAFGYACDHTPQRMPLPIALAHDAARRLERVHRDGTLPWLGADGKTQVAIAFEHRRPVRIEAVSVTASQRRADRPNLEELRQAVRREVVDPVLAEAPVPADDRTRVLLNPGGPQVPGGPGMHAGMTGRKTAIDTYGEYARGGASALSGKDPSRVERVGAYAARHAAVNAVAAGLARECAVQLTWMPGEAAPASIEVDTFGSGRLSDEDLAERLAGVLDFRHAAIVERFDLRGLPARDDHGFYARLAAYGHVGRADLDLPWDRADAVDGLE